MIKQITLGSLFDGSGGFPLAGKLSGIEPVWASEIEPYAIAVTRSHLPEMLHLGDVRKIDGGMIPPVNIITFGSPCQDMSVAGERKGLKHEEHGADETTRSGLFYEAVRVVREMREATNGLYPDLLVFENVPGAYSSNGTEDFQAILREFNRLCGSGHDVPRPPGGRWTSAGEILGDGYNIAWLTLDVQYWLPQRRKRIYLVADLRGERASKILFERKSVRWNPAEGGTTAQGAAGDVPGSADGADREVNVFDSRGNGDGVTAGTITGDHERRVSDYSSIVCVGNGQLNQISMQPIANALDCMHDQQIICGAAETGFKYMLRRLTPTECQRLQGFPDGWGTPEHRERFSLMETMFWNRVRKEYAEANGRPYKALSADSLVRWYNGLHSDTSEYKMWGNGVGLPCAAFVLSGCAEALRGDNK